MKNLKLKLGCLFLTALMAFGLVACTPPAESEIPDPPPGTENPNPPETETPPPPETSPLAEFNLPETLASVNIVTDDGQDITGNLFNQEYKPCAVTVADGREGEDFEGVRGQVRIRGNNTSTFPKKSYRLKFDQKINLLGLNGGAKCKNWVMLACYKDVSFLRDAVVFEFGKKTLEENGYYCSDFTYAQVSVNGKYNGLYFVAEQQQVNKNRVNINEPEEGYTGTDIGYLVEYDGNASFTEEPGKWFELDNSNYPITCEDGSTVIPSQWKTPKALYTVKNDFYSPTQVNFARNYVKNVYRIMYEAVYNNVYYKFNADYTDIVIADEIHDSKTAVENVVELNSYVDMFLLQELACDNDVDFSSFFMTFDMSANGSKKLVLQAPWDFDSGLGMMDGQEKVEKIYTANVSTHVNAAHGLNPWLAVLWKADWFKEACSARWAELKDAGVFDSLIRLIDAVTENYATYFTENYKKWDNLGVYTDQGVQSKEVLNWHTHADASAYLKTWLTNRINFLTGYFEKI